jgi:hypothetical protein
VGFWLGALVIALGLVLPFGEVIERLVVSFFELDWDRSPVPVLLAALCFSFPATLLAVAVLVGAVVVRRLRGATGHVRSVALPTFLLPTHVAGLESLKLMISFFQAPIRKLALIYIVLTGCALLLAIVVGGLGARAWGHRSRMGLPVAPAVGAVVASTALLWWTIWSVLFQYPGPHGSP